MGDDVEAVPAISLWNPWAGAVAHGLKHYETRDHNRLRCLVGKVVAIHAAQRWNAELRDVLARLTSEHAEAFRAKWPEALSRSFYPELGAVVAVAEFDDAQEMTPDLLASVSPLERALGGWVAGRWAYRLGRVLRLPHPVAVSGRQGPFKVVHHVVAEARAALLWRYEVGTPVRYWTGFREGPGRESRTRTPAHLVSGTAVVWVEGESSCIALSHVEALS